MKRCCTCQQTKPLLEFGVLRSSRDGFSRRCKKCSRVAVATTKAKPIEARKKRPLVPKTRSQITRDYRARHPEKYAPKTSRRVGVAMTGLERSRKWGKLHPERMRAKTARYRAKNPDAWRKHYAEKSLDYAVKSARRRAARLSATPEWRNDFFIKEAYDLARRRSAATGFQWEVDHIVPLKSRIVCGLHVEQNLQVISRVANRLKRNRHHA